MKKYITIISLSFFIFVNLGFGQSPNLKQQKRDEIQAQRVAFITQKVKLTTKEAQVFWPLYNEYQEQKNAIALQRRNVMGEIKTGFSDLSDDEFEKLGDKFVQLNVKQAKLNSEYHDKFKTIISSKKVMLLYQAENQFKQYLLKQIKQRSENRDVPRRH